MKTARTSSRVRKALGGSSRGVTLIEALIAMALVGIIAAAFLGGLATASRSAALADIRTNAESLASTQMEYVKSQTYSEPDWDYELPHNGCTCDNHPDWWDDDSPASLPPDYVGYTVKVTAESVPNPDGEDDPFPYIQQITVTVFHYSKDIPVFELEGYKTDTK